MQTGIMRPTPELLIGLTLSLLLHGAFMLFKGQYQPAEIQLSTGRTAVELTLLPSMASAPAAPVEVPPPEPAEVMPDPQPVLEELPFAEEVIIQEEAIIPLPEPVQTEIQPTETPPLQQEQQPVEKETVPVEPAPQESVASQEQIGSVEENKGALTEALPTTRCAPVYPRISHKRSEEGTVVLSVDVDATGRISNIKITQSSGHKRLDNAAIKAVRSTNFTPAQRLGRPVKSTLIMPVQFRLTQ